MNFSVMAEEKGVTKYSNNRRGKYFVTAPGNGKIPHITIAANTVPEAWELAMLSCWDYGTEIHTHYDKDETGKYIHPPSKEATIKVIINNPFNEPRIHRNFPGGPAELEVYRQEVVKGIHDHWINPIEGKWTYTYHERLFNYNPSKDLKSKKRGLLLPQGVNQMDKLINDLARDPTSKGAQATTWMPTADPGLESNRPCLRDLWFRLLEDNEGEYVVNMNCYFRSRDLFKAWFMNVYALTDLHKRVALGLSYKLGEDVKIGEYSDTSDSLHIYGAYFNDAEIEVKKMRNPNMEKRVWSSDEPSFVSMTKEAKLNLRKDPDYYAKGGN